MTFLELVRGLRSRVGMQGTGPASVTSATTAEMDLVNAISDSWVDIQNFREEWRWMRTTKSFQLSSPDTVYELATIFGPTNRMKKWRTDSAYITVDGLKSRMIYRPYDNFISAHINNTVPGRVSQFTVRPWDNALIFTPPQEDYSIQIDYQKTPQILLDNEDIPELPAHFHYAILYYGVQKYDTVVISNESFDQYAMQYAVIMGQIMRSQLDKVIIKTRSIA